MFLGPYWRMFNGISLKKMSRTWFLTIWGIMKLCIIDRPVCGQPIKLTKSTKINLVILCSNPRYLVECQKISILATDGRGVCGGCRRNLGPRKILAKVGLIKPYCMTLCDLQLAEKRPELGCCLVSKAHSND